MSTELPSDAPQARLCHLVKWPDFDGYGFNLHAEKAKSGQFIGKVDDDSPAYHAELKEGDRIVEVNGVNIANENHRQVVERIKAVPNETKLLVLDCDADRWYKERKILVKSSLENVKYVKTPVPRPTESDKPAEQNDTVTEENNVSANTNGTSSSNHSETQSLENGSGSSTPKTVPKQDSPNSSPPSSVRSSESPPSAHKAQNGNSTLNNNNHNNSSNGDLAVSNGVNAKVSTPPPVSRMDNGKTENQPEEVKGTTTTTTANGNGKVPPATSNGAKAPAAAAASKAEATNDLNFNMSAAQMREMLARKKKNDPKKQTMDMREKYQIVQQM